MAYSNKPFPMSFKLKWNFDNTVLCCQGFSFWGDDCHFSIKIKPLMWKKLNLFLEFTKTYDWVLGEKVVVSKTLSYSKFTFYLIFYCRFIHFCIMVDFTVQKYILLFNKLVHFSFRCYKNKASSLSWKGKIQFSVSQGQHLVYAEVRNKVNSVISSYFVDSMLF